MTPLGKSTKKESEITDKSSQKQSVKTLAAKSLMLIPRMSEKTYAVSQSLNTYVFNVPPNANKLTVAQAVSAQYDVSVVSVNISVDKGKVIRTYRKRGRAVSGRQKNNKKAYVTLKKGDTLPLFAAIEEAEAKSEKVSQAVSKAAEKRAKKAEKEKK
jgi:ribosomal protein L23